MFEERTCQKIGTFARPVFEMYAIIESALHEVGLYERIIRPGARQRREFFQQWLGKYFGAEKVLLVSTIFADFEAQVFRCKERFR